MRICFIGNAQSVHMQRWATYFSEHGHKVSIVSPKYAEVKNANLHVIPYSLRRMPIAFWGVRREIRKLKPDILCSHQANVFGLYGVLSGPKPVAIFAYGSDVLVIPELSPFLQWMVKYVVNHADLMICESQTVKSRLLEFGAAESRILMVPMGIDPQIFRSAKMSVKDSPFTIISARAHKSLYNINVILEAFSLVKKKRPDVRLLVAGTGPKSQELKDSTKKLELQKSVQFTGQISYRQMANLYQQSTIMISIPSSDSTSMTLLEAMACGVFPIVSNIPANKEWVNNEINGLLVTHNDPVDLSKAILEALANEKMREQAMEKNLEIIKKRAVWEDNMRKVETRFLEIIKTSQNTKR